MDLRQQSSHPVCQKCNLRVYMNSLRGVDIRSDITWRETFFEPWRKNFDLFLKTAFYVSKGTLWVEKTFFESSVFFQNLRNFDRTFTVLGEKVFGRDIKIEKSSFRLIRFIKKSNFWNFSFFSISSELRTNIYRAWRKNFRQGYQNWKLQSSSQKINQKTKLLEVLFFSKLFRNLNEHLLCLARKFSERDIKIEKCSLRLKRSIKKPNFWKISFFFKLLRTLNEHLPCLAKKFWAGVSKLKIVLCFFRVSFWG